MLMKKLLLAVITSVITIPTMASHVAGGHLDWTSVGQNAYLITLTLYRDCNGVQTGGVSINVKCATDGFLLKSLSISKPNLILLTTIFSYATDRCTTSSSSFRRKLLPEHHTSYWRKI